MDEQRLGRDGLCEPVPRVEEVGTLVTLSAIGLVLTLAATLLVSLDDDVSTWWWIAAGLALFASAVSLTSTVRVVLRRRRFTRSTDQIAAQVALGGSPDLEELACRQFRRALDIGEMDAAVRLDRALREGRRG